MPDIQLSIQTEHLLKLFSSEPYPEPIASVARRFDLLARDILTKCPDSSKAVQAALRLLEAKHLAVGALFEEMNKAFADE